MSHVGKEIAIATIIMTSGRVEVVNSGGCSRLFPGFASSISSINSFRFNPLMSPAEEAIADSVPVGPFTGLIICVTGLSKGKYGSHLLHVGFDLLNLYKYQFTSKTSLYACWSNSMI